MLLKRVSFGLVWLAFITYAFLLAPPNQPETFELIKNMSIGNFTGINPLIIALFNLMGILPIIYACLLLNDGRGQKILAWPFVVGSFGLGAFALLPYIALREANPEFTGERDWLLKILDSRWLGIGLTVAAIGLVTYGLLQGDWSDFIQQWQTSKFIHVMSLDFCLLSVFVSSIIRDDLARREIKNPLIFLIASLIPLFGVLIYLSLRPPLPEQESQLNATLITNN